MKFALRIEKLIANSETSAFKEQKNWKDLGDISINPRVKRRCFYRAQVLNS